MPLPRDTDPDTSEDPAPRTSRRTSLLACLVVVTALMSGLWLLHDGMRTHEPPAPAAAEAVASVGTGAGAGPGGAEPPAAAALPASPPVRIRIPATQVNAPVTYLGLDDRQELQVPPEDDPNLAGWYRNGTTPGAVGPAVLAGHVDTAQGPAVFYNLGALLRGQTIEVDRADNRTAVFTIYGIEVYPKENFPSDRVYDATKDSELRLITCGGGFSNGNYLGNVVVYARLTATK